MLVTAVVAVVAILTSAIVVVVVDVVSLVVISLVRVTIRSTNSEVDDIFKYTMFRDGSHSRSMRCATCDCATAVRASSETTSDGDGEDISLWVVIDTFEECNGLWVGDLSACE